MHIYYINLYRHTLFLWNDNIELFSIKQFIFNINIVLCYIYCMQIR